MQRCFTTFPDNWPGLGLLILRVMMGVALLNSGLFVMRSAFAGGSLWAACPEIFCALLLAGGLWTPLAGGLDAIIEFSLAAASPYGTEAHLMSGTLGLVIVMLGPGAWSIDARLFGRRRIDVEIPRQR